MSGRGERKGQFRNMINTLNFSKFSIKGYLREQENEIEFTNSAKTNNKERIREDTFTAA